MVLDNVTLGELIAKNLFGEKWEKNLKYIIPRKGNFLNPSLDVNAATFVIFWLEKKIHRDFLNCFRCYESSLSDLCCVFSRLLVSLILHFPSLTYF